MMSQWSDAIQQALTITRSNIQRFGKRFPHVSKGDEVYDLNDNTEWTDGFWSGLLWLCYEYKGDPEFRDAARHTVQSFQQRMERQERLDHHDIGFLYSLSSKAQWIIEKDEFARQLTIKAADALMLRWREAPQILQAWGPEGDSENGGRIIIDCLMNLPLLFWATEQTGNPEYARIAAMHADRSRRFLIRGDDSSYHTFYFNPKTGDAVRGGTAQGFNDGSTWTRGQAWGIYGFALAYRYTGNPLYLDTSKRLARYFLARLPEDNVVYWDFDVPVTAQTERDSSASAIAVSGILELISLLPVEDSDRDYFWHGALAQLTSLVKNYSENQPEKQGLIKHGSYAVRMSNSPDDYMIWGDYYYLEALMRLERNIPGYWYER